jgi:uncharacterized RDD family membrane protein YckC
MIKKAPKQFDISLVTVDEKLQGVELSSFERRALALLIDLLILGLANEYNAVIVVITIIILALRKKLQPTIVGGKKLLNQSLDKVNTTLEKVNVNYKVRRNFLSYAHFYITAFIIVIVIFSFISVGWMIYGLINPKEVEEVVSKSAQPFYMSIFKGASHELKFFTGAVGGLIYFSIVNWKLKGQTIGKMLMKIRTVRLDGKPFTLWNSFERASGYTSSASSFFLGFLQVFWDKNHQTTHDKICGTIVVMEDSLKREPENV